MQRRIEEFGSKDKREKAKKTEIVMSNTMTDADVYDEEDKAGDEFEREQQEQPQKKRKISEMGDMKLTATKVKSQNKTNAISVETGVELLDRIGNLDAARGKQIVLTLFVDDDLKVFSAALLNTVLLCVWLKSLKGTSAAKECMNNAVFHGDSAAWPFKKNTWTSIKATFPFIKKTRGQSNLTNTMRISDPSSPFPSEPV